jgi:glutamyl-tRNA synthetase
MMPICASPISSAARTICRTLSSTCLIFEAAGFTPPQFAHLPLLVAPDGTKLSKRRHGPVVSVTTYRDAGFLPEAFINFLCLLGWSPKNDREHMSLQELTDVFSLEGINRSNAVVNFKEPATTPEETFDPKAVWLNAEHIRALPVEDLSARLLPIVHEAGFNVTPEKMLRITPLIRERIKLLRDVLTAADFFFVDQLPPYDPAELIPQKGDAAMALKVLTRAQRGAGEYRVQTRSAGSGSARRRSGTGSQGGTDVSAHPRGGLRAQECPAAV